MHFITKLCIYILAIVNYLLGKALSKSILHPVRLSCVVWGLLVVIPISYSGFAYSWDGLGLIWIETAVFFALIGAIWVKSRTKWQTTVPVNESYITSERINNWWILYVIFILGLISVLISISYNGFSLRDFRSLNLYLKMNSEMAHRRYYSDSKVSFLSSILLFSVYLSPLAGGYAYNYAKLKSKKIICNLGFVPVVLSSLFQNTKAGLLGAVILYLSGWCLSRLNMTKRLPVIEKKGYATAGILCALFFFFLYLLMLVRIGDFSEMARKKISYKFLIYAFGEMIEFDSWFCLNTEFHKYDMGINTYMTLFRLSGAVERIQGVYTYVVKEFGNIFTVFRGIIMDFGVVGGLIYCFLRGCFAQLCIVVIQRNNKAKYLAIVSLATQYLFWLYGLIVSPWIYTSYVLCVLFFAVFLFLFDRKIKFK